MSIWGSLFGKQKKQQSLEEMRDGIDASDCLRVSCMDIVRIVRQRVSELRNTQAMVVILLEGLRVQIFFFDGIARASWGYNNQQFTTDAIGKGFLSEPPMEFALTVTPGADKLLPQVLKREFQGCDMTVGQLWRLDPNAWDYKFMKSLYEDDVGIRISFE
jgi:hypothetical protein